MATYTIYKNLEKPLSVERYDVNVFNKNADAIDSELHKLDQKNQSQDNLLATKESVNEHVNNKKNPHEVSAEQLGLGNVDNTSDMDKPVSTAQIETINDALYEAKNYAYETVVDHSIDNTIHLVDNEREKLNEAYDHSQTPHSPSNAEKNMIVGIKKNGQDIDVADNRTVNIIIPTKTSELTNDSITRYSLGAASKSFVGENVSALNPSYTGIDYFYPKDGSIYRVISAENIVTAISDATNKISTAVLEIGGDITPTNNLLATEPGTPLDAVQGKILDEKIAALKASFENAKSAIVSSALGKALGLTANSKINDVIIAIEGTRGKLCIPWENTSNGAYKFVQDGTKWTSNNMGINSTDATSTWTATVNVTTSYTIKYRVSGESSYDKLTITLDGTTVANAISGNGLEQSYTTTLSPGTHTITATYHKDGSNHKFSDYAYVVLNDIGATSSGSLKLQSASVSPTTTAQTITPSNGYDGLYSVNIGAANSGAVSSVTLIDSAAGDNSGSSAKLSYTATSAMTVLLNAGHGAVVTTTGTQLMLDSKLTAGGAVNSTVGVFKLENGQTITSSSRYFAKLYKIS